MKAKITVSFLLLLQCICGVAQTDQYKYRRELLGIDTTWHKVVLPNKAFEKISHNFSDIRIIGFTKNSDTIEAPYILRVDEEKITQLEVTFKLINRSRGNKGYYFTFEAPIESAINQIVLDFKQQNYDWKLTLAGSQNQHEWFSIIEDYRILSIKNGGTDFHFSKIDFATSKYRYYRLFINSDTQPELIAAKLLLNKVVEGTYSNHTINSYTTDENKQRKQTIIKVSLEEDIPVSKLTINVKDMIDYYRPVTVNYLVDSVKTEKGWKYNFGYLTSGTLNSIEKNEFKFNNTVLKKLEIIIENQNNEPLQIESLAVQGYSQQVIARFIEPASYFLFYGNANAEVPHYDIIRFADKIPTTLTTLTLGNEQLMETNAIEKTKPLFQNKFWLWITMGFIIVLLGLFSIRMIQQK
jgi:hypothetical protein